jgi:hypothetical protein
MKGLVLAGVLFLTMLTGVSAQRNVDPCSLVDIPEGAPTVVYENHCIMVQPEKGPVQGIIVFRGEGLEGFLQARGIIIAFTQDGWVIWDQEFVGRGDVFEDTQPGDGWHMELDEEE